jgi:L-arabinose isomerase
MKNRSNNKLNVGLFGIGLDTYWGQFDGLLDNLLNHIEFVATKLNKHNINVVNLGMIDTSEKAIDAGHEFKRSDVDIIFIYATTYALSHTVLPVVQRAKVPVIILNLAPDKAIDYENFNKLNERTLMTGKWLEFCSACPVPEIANVFRRIGINFYQVTGYLKEDFVWKEIVEWIAAAKVMKIMSHNRVGLMGHYYSGMLDIYTDITNQIAHFGNHFEILEVDELSMLRAQVPNKEIDKRVELFYETFDVQKDCSEEELRRSAKTSVALDMLVNKYNLGSMAYYYMGTGSEANEETINSIILGNSLLTQKGVPVA